MHIENILVGLTIGFPLLGALILLIFKPDSPAQQRLTAASVLLASGLSSLARFFLTGQAGCTFVSGRESCLQAGLLTLSVILLNGMMLYLTMTRAANQDFDYQYYCLVNSTWAGTALINNFAASLAGLSLTLIATSRWVRARGGSVGFVISRDDYKDDIGPPKK